jgi:hypothetical protein
MSNPRAKSARAAAKDLRQGVTEQRERTGSKTKKAKPFIVESRYTKKPWSRWSPGWRKHGAYATEEIARRVIEQQAAKHGSWVEYRLRGQEDDR